MLYYFSVEICSLLTNCIMSCVLSEGNEKMNIFIRFYNQPCEDDGIIYMLIMQVVLSLMLRRMVHHFL